MILFLKKKNVIISPIGKPSYSKIEDVDENMIFSGRENPLLYNRTYTKSFRCNFKLSLYPFDTQVCKIEMVIDQTYINLKK